MQNLNSTIRNGYHSVQKQQIKSNFQPSYKRNCLLLCNRMCISLNILNRLFQHMILTTSIGKQMELSAPESGQLLYSFHFLSATRCSNLLRNKYVRMI